MELSQLETFLAVVEERGFSRAAVRLHRSQPAVSQVIRKLEEDVGEVLFERASRDGSLTAAGELLRDYAKKLLSLRREASSALEELRSLERGRLHLAANEYTCLYLLPILDEFRRLCPQVGVTVHRSLASRIPDELMQRTVEMGIVSFRPREEELRSISVYTDELTFVVNPNHPLAREKRVSIRDLGAENFVAHNVSSTLRKQVIETFAQHKTPLNMGVELPSLEAIKRFVAMGNGVALVPGLTVQRELEQGELVRVPVTELQLERQLRILHRRNSSLSHAAVAFLKVVRSVAARRGAPFQYHLERSAEAPST
ncbi:MAG TPA: LysR substrate-binding domain-containing protein [Acidisarcina sp.]|nr:LysR substrate-binding domain-containing protein [Acidisarcina sp.]